MNEEPRIEKITDIPLIGMSVSMSFADNKTRELWQTFMPRLNEITTDPVKKLYSVEVYHEADFFNSFDPTKKFQKWAAIEIPEDLAPVCGMRELIIPGGQYAVFTYRGSPRDAAPFYQYVLSIWVPNSEYELDHRPHFAVMGEKYKHDDPRSEEELWFPIIDK